MLKRICILSILFVCLAAFTAPLKIGWAERNVTPRAPIPMTGLFNLRISKGILDPTTVTALAIDNGKDSVIFLSCDVIGLTRSIVGGIQKRLLERDPKFPVRKLIVNATHTHTSGALYGIDKLPLPEECRAGVEQRYVPFFIRQAADAVIEAWEKRVPGSVAWGYGYAVTSHSRRIVYLDDLSKRPGGNVFTGYPNGYAKMHGSTADSKFSHFEAGSDPFVNYLFTFTPDGKLTGGIINLSSPAQCGGGNMQKISADYWHQVRKALRKKYGPVHILPQCAAAGDLTPRLQLYKKAQARRFRLKYGPQNDPRIPLRLDVTEQIVNSFDEVLSWAGKDRRSDLPLYHTVSLVQVARRMVTDAESAEARKFLAELENRPVVSGTAEERMEQETRRNTLRNKLKNVIARAEVQKKKTTLPTEIHIVRLGDIAFATNNFELFIDYMHRIRGRSPFEQTFIVQLAGSPRSTVAGYLPTARAVANKGYSATVYCSDVVSPRGGQQLVDETVRLLRQVHRKAD